MSTRGKTDAAAVHQADADRDQAMKDLAEAVKPHVKSLQGVRQARWKALGFPGAVDTTRSGFVHVCLACGSLNVGIWSYYRDGEHSTVFRCEDCGQEFEPV